MKFLTWIITLLGFIKTPPTICPECGSDRMYWSCKDYTLTLTKGIFVVRNLTYQECQACYGALLDHEAMKRIEAVVAGDING